MVSFDNKVLVPFHFNNLDLVLLLLPFVLGNDDEVGVGALEDVLDGVVEDPLHIAPPQRGDELTLACHAQQSREIPDLDNSSPRSWHISVLLLDHTFDNVKLKNSVKNLRLEK